MLFKKESKKEKCDKGQRDGQKETERLNVKMIDDCMRMDK